VREASGRELTKNGGVAVAFLDHQGLSPFGDCIQLFLVEENLVVQARQAKRCTR
jgi:hypothetical protein